MRATLAQPAECGTFNANVASSTLARGHGNIFAFSIKKMPWRSEAQRRLCWVKYNEALSHGEAPKWDCRKWEHETPKSAKKELPYHKPKQCTGKCRSGKRCKRYASKGSIRCHLH